MGNQNLEQISLDSSWSNFKKGFMYSLAGTGNIPSSSTYSRHLGEAVGYLAIITPLACAAYELISIIIKQH